MIDKETEELLVAEILTDVSEEPPSDYYDSCDTSHSYYQGWERGLLDAAAAVRKFCKEQGDSHKQLELVWPGREDNE